MSEQAQRLAEEYRLAIQGVWLSRRDAHCRMFHNAIKHGLEASEYKMSIDKCDAALEKLNDLKIYAELVEASF